MNRRNFFTALAALPFVPGMLEKLGAEQTFHYYGDMTAEPVIGRWVGVETMINSNPQVISGPWGDYDFIEVPE